MNNNKITLLLIGHHSPKVSGSALSFGRLYKKIKLDNRINYYFINTSRRYKDVHSIFVNINVGINAIYQFLKIMTSCKFSYSRLELGITMVIPCEVKHTKYRKITTITSS